MKTEQDEMEDITGRETGSTRREKAESIKKKKEDSTGRRSKTEKMIRMKKD